MSGVEQGTRADQVFGRIKCIKLNVLHSMSQYADGAALTFRKEQ